MRLALLDHNFTGTGTGSACAIRRDRALSVGGYDASLRARAAQGCEELALYIAPAERRDFAAVPRFFVGYRQHAASLSRNARQMAAHPRSLMRSRGRSMKHPAISRPRVCTPRNGPPPPSLSITVCTRNRPVKLRRCIGASAPPAPGLRRHRRVSRRQRPTATTPSSASAASGFPAASASASPSPVPRPRAGRPDPRRRHQRARQHHRAGLARRPGRRGRGARTIITAARRLSTIESADHIVFLEVV